VWNDLYHPDKESYNVFQVKHHRYRSNYHLAEKLHVLTWWQRSSSYYYNYYYYSYLNKHILKADSLQFARIHQNTKHTIIIIIIICLPTVVYWPRSRGLKLNFKQCLIRERMQANRLKINCLIKNPNWWIFDWHMLLKSTKHSHCCCCCCYVIIIIIIIIICYYLYNFIDTTNCEKQQHNQRPIFTVRLQ